MTHPSEISFSPSNRILLVSDNAQLRALLSRLLAAHRYDGVAVEGCAPLEAGGDWDAAIVDAAAAHGAARWLRTLDRTGHVPTLAIAAAKNGAAADTLWSRVDAVLHEPFDARKLLLVMRGLFADRRETAGRAGQAALTTGPVTLHSLLNTATVEAREVSLTGAEARVLRELMLAPSTPVTRDKLTRCGLGRGSSPDDRCLDTHIKRLRRKLGTDRHGRTPIRTVRSIGYLLLEQWQPASQPPL
jgi:two-component system OmpR family response regulator